VKGSEVFRHPGWKWRATPGRSNRKRFLYSEIVKISPVIHTPDMIEELIGDRPAGCDRPSATLSKVDLERYRREGVGPNEYVEE